MSGSSSTTRTVLFIGAVVRCPCFRPSPSFTCSFEQYMNDGCSGSKFDLIFYGNETSRRRTGLRCGADPTPPYVARAATERARLPRPRRWAPAPLDQRERRAGLPRDAHARLALVLELAGDGLHRVAQLDQLV